MPGTLRRGSLASLAWTALASWALARGGPTLPHQFGTSSYTVIAVPITMFSAADASQVYSADGTDFFRYFPAGTGTLVGGAVVPTGAVIDFVGIGACDFVGGAFAVRAFKRSAAGGIAYETIAEFGTSAHNGGTPCAMDYNPSPLGFLVSVNEGSSIQLTVEQLAGSPVDGSARAGSVEIWYRLSVHPAPPTPSFGDVPGSHPYFQFVEALKAAGITNGCGGGNFCPDSPVTRAQLAAMLAKALGLFWPG